MKIHYIGLGKMGLNMCERLIEKGHTVRAYDPDATARERANELGAKTFNTYDMFFDKHVSNRVIWLMVPHMVVEDVLQEITPFLNPGDTIIEGGNSPFKETVRRAKEIEGLEVNFLDAGVSGGPGGAKHGACIMVGGKKEVFSTYEDVFRDLSVPNGYAYMGESGTGHFVKMIHNGIEYGMMQAIAEGFDIIKNAPFSSPLPLTTVAKLYSNGSVIESSLTKWLHQGFETYGEELESISGSASASGEGLWTVETAHELRVDVPVIQDSLNVRTNSQEKPSFQGKIISVLRNMFGGHEVKK